MIIQRFLYALSDRLLDSVLGLLSNVGKDAVHGASDVLSKGFSWVRFSNPLTFLHISHVAN